MIYNYVKINVKNQGGSMVKYKYTLTWLILFAIALAIAAVTMGTEGMPDIYNPGVIVGAVLVLFCCPAFIYDKKNTEKYKLKQEEKKLQLELQRKKFETIVKQQGLDLERQKIAIEQEKAKLEAKIKDPFKYCVNCGKQIEQTASICPFCGSILKKEPETTAHAMPHTTPQPTQQIIIQQAPKPNIWKQLVAWIISEVAYCIMFMVMTTLMIVMTFLFLI